MSAHLRDLNGLDDDIPRVLVVVSLLGLLLVVDDVPGDDLEALPLRHLAEAGGELPDEVVHPVAVVVIDLHFERSVPVAVAQLGRGDLGTGPIRAGIVLGET